MTGARRFAVIGIAGGIGSGKSTVAWMLADLGCVVVDSDAEARRALLRPEVIAELVGWWGCGVLDGAGAVDRRAVARIVFADAGQRARLEGLIHPLIAQSRARQIEEARKAGRAGAVIDAPLLYEAGLEAECDAVIFVDCPFEERLARVRASRGWDERELRQREKAQLPLEEKRRRADYQVVNTGNLQALRPQVAQIFTSITEASKSSDGPMR